MVSLRAYEAGARLVRCVFTSPTPMRALALAALTFATPVAAQTGEPPRLPPPDTSEALPELTRSDLLGEPSETAAPTPRLSPYSALGLSAGFAGATGVLARAEGAFGVEAASGVRVGLRSSALSNGAHTLLGLGPEVGYRRALGGGFALHAQGQAAASVAVGQSLGADWARTSFGARTLSAGGALAVEREVPLVGSLRLAPSAGLYGTLGRRSAIPTLGLGESTRGSAGLLLGTDLRFRAFGRDVSVPMTLPLRLLGAGPTVDAFGQPLGGASLRVGF